MSQKKRIQISSSTWCKIHLFTAIIGIFILFLLPYFIHTKEINVCKIKDFKEGDYISVYGKIISEKNLTKDFTILTLQNSSCKIEITCNCKNFLNQTVKVTGHIEYYNNKTQINAERIETR
jgi:hypothetical protein